MLVKNTMASAVGLGTTALVPAEAPAALPTAAFAFSANSNTVEK